MASFTEQIDREYERTLATPEEIAALIRCNVKDCDHPEDEELSQCESCRENTCFSHARRYGIVVLCAACSAKERAAKAVFRNAVMEKLGASLMTLTSAEDLADQVRGLCDALEQWDVEVKA